MAAVSSLIPAPLTGKAFLRASHIPFLGDNRDGPDQTFKTTFQADYNPHATFPKRGAIPRPPPAQLEHRDLGRIRDYLTEAVESYSRPPRSEVSRTPAWTRFCTNFKMHTDPRLGVFLTTQKEGFQNLPAHHPPPGLIRHETSVMINQPQEEPWPDTTHNATFTAYHVSPVVKPEVKHLGGEPTIRGDREARHVGSTHHSEAYQGRWVNPPQPVEKHFHSSVAMGDPEKVLERETTHNVSFSHPGVHSPVNVKQRLKVNLGDFSENKWTTTKSDAFRGAKSGPLLLVRRIKTLSSVSRGDSDPGRNRESMTATTNGFFFPEGPPREGPEHVRGANRMTRSNVQLGRPGLGGRFYTTAAQEHYPPRGDQDRARPHTHPPGHVLGGHERGPALTTVQRDYLPLTCRWQELNPGQLHQIKASHITAPSNQQHFSTTHQETFGPKSLSRTCLDHPPLQHISHMPF